MTFVRSTIGLLVAATIAAPAVASSSTTFAQFTQKTSARTIAYGQSGASNSLTVISAPASVNFVVTNFGLPAFYTTNFNLTASTTSKVQIVAGNMFQPGWFGTMSFTNGTTNFLTVQFSGATLNVQNGNSASLIGATPAESIFYSSDILSVSPTGPSDFAIGLSGFSRTFSRLTNGAGKDYGRSLNASAAGTFAGTSAVPEPATWTILVAGFGLIGMAVRRRRQTAVTV